MQVRRHSGEHPKRKTEREREKEREREREREKKEREREREREREKWRCGGPARLLPAAASCDLLSRMHTPKGNVTVTTPLPGERQGAQVTLDEMRRRGLASHHEKDLAYMNSFEVQGSQCSCSRDGALPSPLPDSDALMPI